jgi:hypothetical protein
MKVRTLRDALLNVLLWFFAWPFFGAGTAMERGVLPESWDNLFTTILVIAATVAWLIFLPVAFIYFNQEWLMSVLP